ncbi:MAG: WXG100 family type VII secretion target [Eubacterium sp.]
MAGTIKISTDQVEAIATSIENSNKKLKATLEESQTSMKSLNSTWQGEASQATIAAYDSFAAQYFQNYYDIIDSYVKFLRQNVSADYQATETANTNLADAFK